MGFSAKTITKTNISIKDIQKSLKNTVIKVGVPKSKGAKIHDESDISIATVAMVNEFGSPARGIPERSFVRSTVQAEEKNIKKLFQQETKKVIAVTQTTKNMMGLVGEYTSGQIKKTIVALKTPANADSTVASKGSSNPLVDTGQLLQSITYEVVDD